MTLEQLQALAAVGRAGSVAEGARQSGVPRTSLNRRIASLEADLGVALLMRGPAGATLTPHGQRLAERGQSLLDEVADLGVAIRDDHDTGGVLRVSYPVGIHPMLLVASCRVLTEALPQVRFQVVPPGTDLGETDVGIHLGVRPPQGPLVVRTLARVPARLLAGPAYPRPVPSSPEELRDHPLFYWSDDSAAPSLPLLPAGSLPVRPRIVTPDLHFLHQAARAGAALVWAVDGGIDEGPGVDRLRPVLADQIGCELGVWLVLPETPRLAPRIREAIRCIQELVELAVHARASR